jgi:glutamate-1-semialdehyde aminotransferase
VVAALAQLRYLSSNYEEIVGRLDSNHTALAGQLADIASSTGIPVALRGHPRMGFHLAVGETEPEEKNYRSVMASSSPSHLRALLAMTFYLRLNGIYAKVIPTMNLSAAHTGGGHRARCRWDTTPRHSDERGSAARVLALLRRQIGPAHAQRAFSNAHR